MNLLNIISPYKVNWILSLVLLDRVILGTWISNKTLQFYGVIVSVWSECHHNQHRAIYCFSAEFQNTAMAKDGDTL